MVPWSWNVGQWTQLQLALKVHILCNMYLARPANFWTLKRKQEIRTKGTRACVQSASRQTASKSKVPRCRQHNSENDLGSFADAILWRPWQKNSPESTHTRTSERSKQCGNGKIAGSGHKIILKWYYTLLILQFVK